MEFTAGRDSWSTSQMVDQLRRDAPFAFEASLKEFDDDVSKQKIRKEIVSRRDVDASFIAAVQRNTFFNFKATDLLESA